MADQKLDTVALDAADSRQGVLQGTCADRQMRYAAIQIDGKGIPMALETCSGDGRVNTARLSPDSTLGDRANVTLDMSDGKHLKGRIAVGVGSTRHGEVESFGETTGEYQFDVDLSPLTLRDRVLAEGDQHASGVPAAKATLVKYFAAVAESRSLSDIAAWLTPENRSQAEAKFADAEAVAPNFAKRIYETFVKSHSRAPTITGAKAIGAAAVITSEMSSGSVSMTCETLLLQIDAAWKVGKEVCRSPEHGQFETTASGSGRKAGAGSRVSAMPAAGLRLPCAFEFACRRSWTNAPR